MAGADEVNGVEDVLGLLGLIRGTLRDLADRAPQDLDAGIDGALRDIGQAVGSDRSYLFSFDPTVSWLSNTHEWCAAGITPQRDQLQGVSVDVIAWWIAPFRRGEAVHVPSVSDLPDERRLEREELAREEIRSLVVVPLTTGGRLVGFLGFDAVRSTRTWSEGEIVLLRTVADGICAALMRREAVDALGEGEQRYSALVRHSSDVVMIVEDDATLVYLGSAASAILGWSPQRRTGTDLLSVVHPDDRAQVQGALAQAAANPGVDITVPDHRLAHLDGTWRWFLATAVDLRGEAAIGGTLVTAHDITSRKLAEEALRHQAVHDSLTGLPNRALLLDRLERSLERVGRSDRSVGVVFVDVDRFKLINDAIGHDRGDELLVEVARRLLQQVRPSDTVARFGGDEFVVLLDEMSDHDEALAATDAIVAAFDAPFVVDGRAHELTASAGVVLGTHRADPATLLQDADSAMYQAKECGRGRIRTFDAPLRAELLRRVELAQGLHGSVARGELELAYQPLFELAGGDITGVEALLRWNHPVHGPIPPADFIPLAEDHGLIVRLGRWVIDQALRQLDHWDRHCPTLSGVVASVNLSVHQLTDGDLPATVDELLAVHGLAPSRLCLELTESALMAQPETGRAVLSRLRARGVGLAIDDFGTGYSSLAYLRELPVTTLKIDRSFVARLGIDERDGRVLAAILGLAQEFGLQAVAEGIETPVQLAALRRLGCGSGQGYLLQRPVDPATLAEVAGRVPSGVFALR